jgi:hypothetical protein
MKLLIWFIPETIMSAAASNSSSESIVGYNFPKKSTSNGREHSKPRNQCESKNKSRKKLRKAKMCMPG